MSSIQKLCGKVYKGRVKQGKFQELTRRNTGYDILGKEIHNKHSSSFYITKYDRYVKKAEIKGKTVETLQ